MKALAIGSLLLVLLVAGGYYVTARVLPRPPDTTDPAVFAGDGAALDDCALPVLDGQGPSALDIPRAYTPGCGWTTWPMHILAECREPLGAGVRDLRGLWKSVTPGIDHIERIEQCGNRSIVITRGIIHDFITDGTLRNGARDVQRPDCTNIHASIEWNDGVMEFSPFGLPYTIVTRRLDGNQLVWTYPTLGEVRMERICSVAAAR